MIGSAPESESDSSEEKGEEVCSSAMSAFHESQWEGALEKDQSRKGVQGIAKQTSLRPKSLVLNAEPAADSAVDAAPEPEPEPSTAIFCLVLS